MMSQDRNANKETLEVQLLVDWIFGTGFSAVLLWSKMIGHTIQITSTMQAWSWCVWGGSQCPVLWEGCQPLS